MHDFIVDNSVFRQLFTLILILISVYAISVIILGPKRKKSDQNHYALFGKYTKYIPNIMCYLRFPLGLWLFCVYYFSALHTLFFAVTFHFSFALICLFDFLDGKFARKWNAITEDGKSLDPAADKWSTFCLAVTAFMFGELRWWVLFIVFAREIISMLQRMRLRRRGEDASAKWLGKLKTGVQFTALYIIIIRSGVLPDTVFYEMIAKILPGGFVLWGMILLCFATVISVFPYFKSFSYVNDYTRSQFKESPRAWYIVMIPNLFTVGNYLCGVTAVFFAMPEVEVAYRPFVCLFWILAAGFCDAFDGPLARKLNSHSDFGACLDSSIDLSTFGLATAVIILLRFSEIQGGLSYLGIGIALVYFVYVHLRLARFTALLNQNTDKGKKHDFVGLPSPPGAIAVLIAFTFFNNIFVLSASIILISLLMYSKLDFISHSNSIHHSLYRYFLIPATFAGFFMLIVLIFQQPFVTAHFARELMVYFRICSWILAVSMSIYVFDAICRTYVKS